MWELFTDPSNIFFSVSLSLMLLLGVTEFLLLLVGTSSQGFLDQFVPDQLAEVNHPDLDITAQQSIWVQLLDWLYLGRVPVLIWLIIFLTVYALTGFVVQSIFFQFTEHFFPVWIIAPACIFLCMPIVRLSVALIGKILPKDETTAIYSHELIGLKAEIILGEARLNYPAQAKVKDQHGQTHYILVEPEIEAHFKQGQVVILTHKTANGFQAIETQD